MAKTIDTLKEQYELDDLLVVLAKKARSIDSELQVEITGLWVWVQGDTKPHKDALKDLGFRWMHKKQQWAFVGKKSFSKGNYSMDQIRELHGSIRV